MADKNETIKELLAGFNTMSQQLGLLPKQSNDMPLGVPLPQLAAPPQVMHPGAMSGALAQGGLGAAQQTISFAQQTRYAPPPSVPPPFMSAGLAGPTLGAMGSAQINPYTANFMGGGAMSLPSPIYNTGAQYGINRPAIPQAFPGSHGFGMPSIFNPLAPNIPGANFRTPVDQSFALSQVYARQAGAGAVAGMQGIARAGFGLGGSLLGSSMGGPIGGILGGFAGDLIGRGVSSVMGAVASPYLRELGVGQFVENQSKSFMVSGAHLSPTGAGLDPYSSRQVARGLTGMGRDHNLTRETGFNTSDFTKIFQMGSQQGFMDMANNPQQILDITKNLAKSLKTFMQIAQEPDIQQAIKMMGQMRGMGLNTAEINSAAFNARQFARMAGTSVQGAFNTFGQPGAAMAQGIGLSAGFGANVGMAGGAMSRLAVSSGAFNEQQLAMAGGIQGMAQTNAMSGMAAVNVDAVLPGLVKNVGGKLQIDQAMRRKYQRGEISMSDLIARGASNLQDWGQMGIENLMPQMQQMKDSLGRSLGPQGAQMLALRQALDIRKETGGTLGGAFMKLGYGAQQSRSLELQYQNQEFWNSQMAQLDAEARDNGDRQRARWSQYDTPSLTNRMRRGVKGAINSLTDAMSSPFRAVGDWYSGVREDNAAMNRGERILRYGENETINSGDERSRIDRFISSGGFDRYMGRNASALQQAAGQGLSYGSASFSNRALSSIGLSRKTSANRLQELAAQAGGGFGAMLGGGVLGVGAPGTAGAIQTLESVEQAALTINRADRLDASNYAQMAESLQSQGSAKAGGFDIQAAAGQAAAGLLKKIEGKHAGLLTEAGAANENDFKEPWIDALTGQGMSRSEAESYYAKNKDNLRSIQYRKAVPFASDQGKEALGKSLSINGKYQAATGVSKSMSKVAKDNLEDQIGKIYGIKEGAFFSQAARSGVMEKASALVSKNGGNPKALALAGLMSASAHGDKGADAKIKQLRGTMTDAEFSALEGKAINIAEGMSGGDKKIIEKIAMSGSDALGNFSGILEHSEARKIGTAMELYGKKLEGKGLSAEAMGAFRKNDMAGFLGGLSDSDMELMPELSAAKKALARGDKASAAKLAQTAIVRGTAVGRKTVLGGVESADAIERKANTLQLADEAQKAGNVTEATLANAAVTLESAADKLLAYASNVKGSSEVEELLKAIPLIKHQG